jgi:hypothetical protein
MPTTEMVFIIKKINTAPNKSGYKGGYVGKVKIFSTQQHTVIISKIQTCLAPALTK